MGLGNCRENKSTWYKGARMLGITHWKQKNIEAVIHIWFNHATFKMNKNNQMKFSWAVYW